jgi:hypothetical protein
MMLSSDGSFCFHPPHWFHILVLKRAIQSTRVNKTGMSEFEPLFLNKPVDSGHNTRYVAHGV